MYWRYVFGRSLTGANDAQHPGPPVAFEFYSSSVTRIELPLERWQALGLTEAELNCAESSIVLITGMSQHFSIHL